MTNDDIPNQTSPLYNVQPTSHTSEKRIFPSLPYTSENLKFINAFYANLTSNCLTLQTPNTLLFAICYSSTKHVMQLIKMMLEKFQHPSVFDSNLMLNL